MKYVKLKSPTGIIVYVPVSCLETFELDVLNGWRLSIIDRKEMS